MLMVLCRVAFKIAFLLFPFETKSSSPVHVFLQNAQVSNFKILDIGFSHHFWVAVMSIPSEVIPLKTFDVVLCIRHARDMTELFALTTIAVSEFASS